MLRAIAIMLLFYIVIVVATLMGVRTARGADCGPLPQEPETPAGCVYLLPVCQCSFDGTICRIVWVCAALTPDLQPPRPRQAASNVLLDEDDDE